MNFPLKKENITSANPGKYTIVIHGGAGNIKQNKFTPEREQQYKQVLTQALLTGEKAAKSGKTAVEIVEQVIMVLEDSPLFNAGKGSVFSHDGIQEMDASIMDGKTLNAGAVAGVTNLKNPIQGARIVMDSTKHVFLYGQRAQEFCIQHGAQYADSAYFFTERRWKQFQKALKKDQIKLDHDDNPENNSIKGEIEPNNEDKKYGTVGCVVRDVYGNLAAGTSTGGLTNKKYGRIGDSPVIGAGTYANNLSCAVSCTGIGEFFIRGTIARDIAALMEYKKISLQQAAAETLNKLNTMNGRGGFIAVDNKGNFIMEFNTSGMYRGVIQSGQQPSVKIFK